MNHCIIGIHNKFTFFSSLLAICYCSQIEQNMTLRKKTIELRSFFVIKLKLMKAELRY
jgi:hypothetical protein